MNFVKSCSAFDELNHYVEDTRKLISASAASIRKTYLGLARIVQKGFDRSLAQVLGERVFEPCGSKKAGWRKEENDKLVWLGENYIGKLGGEANLFVSTRELACWGHLHLAKENIRGNKYYRVRYFNKLFQ